LIYKNEWRFKEGSNEQIIQIIMKYGFIADIDAHRHAEIAEFRWHAWYSGRGITRYAVTTNGETPTYMHVLLFPNMKSQIDHKDKNGLNNIEENLRSGADGINQRNRSGTREGEIAGVINLEHRRQTIAYWTERDGKSVRKQFTWSQFNNDKKAAYEAAVKCRTENNDRVMKELADNPRITPIQKKGKRPKVSNTGVKNVRFMPSQNLIRANITINNKSHQKNFHLSKYSKEDAIENARLWVAKIQEENPSQKKKQKVNNN